MNIQQTKTLGVGLAAVLFTSQLSGCGATQGIKPSQTSCNQFLTQLKGHQYGPAYSLLTTNCKAATSQQQMQNYWELVEKNRGKVQSFTQQGVRFYSGTGGSNVQLAYGLKGTTGSSSVTFTCVEENSKWLIQGFNFSG